MIQIIHWWIFFCAQIGAYFVAWHYDIFTLTWVADISKLSFIIMGIHLLSTLWIGVLTLRKTNNIEINENTGWFLSELVLSLGMVGTLIGFIYMIVSSLTSLPAELTVEQLRTLIGALALGIGTALWTTLWGLIVSICLKVQMNNLQAVKV